MAFHHFPFIDELPDAQDFDRRPGLLGTQYLEIDDCAAGAILIARPVWLWGAEHGVNEHGLAVGNEKIHTVREPAGDAPALLGMDLVRLALERARSAECAVETLTSLIERHGQGGVADKTSGEAYFSSYLVADASGSYIIETSARTWVVKRADRRAAISNRLSVGRDFVASSADVEAGADFDEWRNREVPTHGRSPARVQSGLPRQRYELPTGVAS